MSKLTDQELIVELQKRFEENTKSIQELKDLTEELKVVNRKLEESEALKSHFISNITNEIINPFTSILGLSRNILAVKKENWKKVISMVALIHSEAFNLDFQLRNIFLAAKIEAGEIYPEILNVDLKNLIKNILDAFRIESKKKNISIDFQFDIKPEKGIVFYFKTDPEKIRLALANLISNAIKFSYDDSKIVIRASKIKDIVNISVQDFGTGISEANQKIIFDRFKRLDSGINSLNRGHGLGLSINKAVIDLLQGKIEIKSEVNKGATFTLLVPEAKTNIAGFSTDGNEFLFDDEEIF
jgi:signal transduction histidine kinase